MLPLKEESRTWGSSVPTGREMRKPITPSFRRITERMSGTEVEWRSQYVLERPLSERHPGWVVGARRVN